MNQKHLTSINKSVYFKLTLQSEWLNLSPLTAEVNEIGWLIGSNLY